MPFGSFPNPLYLMEVTRSRGRSPCSKCSNVGFSYADSEQSRADQLKVAALGGLDWRKVKKSKKSKS